MSMKIILIGAPGSGKGTQAKMLIEEEQCVHLATGDILREAIKQNSELGIRAKDYMDKGALVPDSLIIDMMREKMKNLRSGQGFILDGFPRTIPQAESLGEMLDSLGILLDRVVYLEVTLDKIVERMAGRLTCPKCGRSYHSIFNKPQDEMVCDDDRSTLIIREDDKEAVVIGRYNIFLDQTKPLINYYKNKNLLSVVNAEQDISVIYQSIKDLFN